MKKSIMFVFIAISACFCAWLMLSLQNPQDISDESVQSASSKGVIKSDGALKSGTVRNADAGDSESSPSDDVVESDDGEAEVKTHEELAEEAEEAAVESFDALTDAWMEPSEKGVTIEDVDNFLSRFKKVPPSRREECLQRALNLVPDENVMLLAGVLMDKSLPKELVELVFNDVLNRDEDVKKPILREIFKDKTHPCWADTAWIFDATGETPAGGRSND